MWIAALTLGIVLGAAAAWLVAGARRAAETARLEAQLEAAFVSSSEKLELVERTQAEWEERFRALSSETLTQNQSRFLELAQTQLKPIEETLRRFGEHTNALEQSRKQAYGELYGQVRTLSEGQEKLRSETGNLVTAMRAPHVRGRWGEIQLKRVVELAGMVAYCDFVEQSSGRDDDGRLLRPDLIVKLPGGKNIVVDAKSPGAAYLDALACEDDDVRRAHFVAHARQVREHIIKLGQKRYWAQFAPAPEFVVMFLPDDSFWRAALDHDPSLIEAGPEAGVLPVTPTSLIGLLRTVAYTWQQENLADGAREISKLGGDLVDRLGVFARHLAKVGRSLDTAVGSYNDAIGSLETRVLVTARKLEQHQLGSEELPDVAPLERQPRPIVAPELLPSEPGASGPGRSPARESAVRDGEPPQMLLELPGGAADAA
jgi:DNA recombination protein RmuC